MVVDANTIVSGKYRIVRLIGDGGMGAVYEAEHLILKVPVALKFLHADLAERPGLAERFLREARVSASIQSPHVARVTDVDQTEAGTPFLVMELLHGQSLQELLDREHQLPESTCIDYALQILSGLEAAHAINVVHRDLKPDNVIITQSRSGPLLKLIDFGIAKLRSSEEFRHTLTRAGVMMGTPEYMAPEQLYSAENVDARADIFSLGVMLYEMLAGMRPVEGDEAVEIIGKFVSGSVAPLRQRLPSVSEPLARLVHRALEPEREQRFASALDMRMALAPLAGALSHAGQLAATPAPVPVHPEQSSLPSEEPDPSTRRTSVADTLPPARDSTAATEDDPALSERGGTEAAVPNLREPWRAPAPAMAPPPSPAAEQAAALRIQPAALPHPADARRRPRKRTGLIAFFVVLLVVLGAAMVVLLLQSRRSSQPPPGLDLDTTPALGTVEPDATGAPRDADTTSAPQQVEPPPARQPQSRPESPVPRTPTPRPPTGPEPSPADAGPVFPFPSSLPPLPSSLPPLPSGFPTVLPSFFPPIPGLTPPNQAPTGKQDAGP